MKSIIEEIYNGSIQPLGASKNQKSKQADLAKKLINEYQDILERFPDCKEAFESYLDKFAEHESECAYEQFIKGFRVGAQLMLEMIYPIE